MKPRILLVEDDNFIREMYQDELIRSGFEVAAYENGEDGLRASQQKHFDLVLLDIMLPGMNGLEVLKQIKANPQNKDLKVVILTNLGQEAVIKEGFTAGALGYLIKSAYNPDQIIQEVKKFIASSS